MNQIRMQIASEWNATVFECNVWIWFGIMFYVYHHYLLLFLSSVTSWIMKIIIIIVTWFAYNAKYVLTKKLKWPMARVCAIIFLLGRTMDDECWTCVQWAAKQWTAHYNTLKYFIIIRISRVICNTQKIYLIFNTNGGNTIK